MAIGMKGGKASPGSSKSTGKGTTYPKASWSVLGNSSSKASTSQLGALKVPATFKPSK